MHITEFDLLHNKSIEYSILEVCKWDLEPKKPNPAWTGIWVWAGKISSKLTAHDFSLNSDFLQVRSGSGF
uniref:Uncharacterized protein n=1 Tax=Rhizophagus irregularis (strain DAOM 181602 / DAOM 197198 / MUCL 43194) TaxID=747089 RepID=U9T9X1_RHIID